MKASGVLLLTLLAGACVVVSNLPSTLAQVQLPNACRRNPPKYDQFSLVRARGGLEERQAYTEAQTTQNFECFIEEWSDWLCTARCGCGFEQRVLSIINTQLPRCRHLSGWREVQERRLCESQVACKGCAICPGVFTNGGPRFFQVRSNLTRLSPAADVIIIIDESLSMATEHRWTRKMTEDIEIFLKQSGVGNGPGRPNLYGLVGFGRSGVKSEIFSPMFRAERYNEVFRNVKLEGDQEDGLEAIYQALTNQTLRRRRGVPGIATNLILITDEGRFYNFTHPENDRFNVTYIKRLLVEERALLNVVVRQNISAPGAEALTLFGLDFQRNAYYQVGDTGNYGSVSGGEPDGVGAYVNHEDPVWFRRMLGPTRTYYTDLALDRTIKGAVWSLDSLKDDNVQTTEAFTKAFVAVKVNETLIRTNECSICACDGVLGRFTCRAAPDQRYCCDRAQGRYSPTRGCVRTT